MLDKIKYPVNRSDCSAIIRPSKTMLKTKRAYVYLQFVVVVVGSGGVELFLPSWNS
jgi:hypothetical protein